MSSSTSTPAKPFAPTPGPAPAGPATSAEKPKEQVDKAIGEALAAKAPAPPTAPAAKAAAAKESPTEVASAATARATVKPATAATKAPGTAPAAAAAAAPKADEATAKAKASDEQEVPKGGKAAALAPGTSATPAAFAKAGTAAKSGAAAKAASAPPTSAAAVMEVGTKKPATAVERMAATGSVLARGPGAEPEPAKAKAKAKATPVAAAPAMPKPAGAPTAAARGYPTPPGAAAPAAPANVLDIVTGKPQPILEAGGVNAPTIGGPPAATSGAPVGPARAYAKVAAPAVEKATVAAASSGKPVEVPKEGPAAVATGRAVLSGTADPIKVQGKAKVPIGKKFQIVFVTGEVAPYSKTGGLGEAMDGLPVALAALGHRVMVVAPRYDQYKEAWDTSFWSSVTMAGKDEPVHFFHAFKQKVDHVFVDHPCFLERVDGLSGAKLYGPEWGKDFADNQSRFAYFCKAALVAIKDLPLAGYPYGEECVVVANDWHSALVPMFMHAQKQADPSLWQTTKTAFLCHNAVFQGRFACEEGLAHVLDVPQQYVDSITFRMPLKVGKYNEKVKCVNTMAAGLRYSDRALTVSPTYARECAADPEKGVELEELFAGGRVTGILNGVKEGVSPSEKNFVTKTRMLCGTFTAATAPAAKEQLKVAYRAESGLPESEGPMMCFIGRLDAQKGYDLLLEALMDVLEDTELQVVIVGAGRADLVAQTKAVEKKFPKKFYYAGWMGPERYALLAGCDYTLLPSRWEPCGLVQMEAMRMGTLPIVAPTGGLKDTVEDGVNGIWTDAEMTVEAELDEESSASLARALRRASEIHTGTPEKEQQMMRAAMAAAAEFTWSNAALQYEAVFEEMGVPEVLSKCPEKAVTLEVDKQVC